MSSKRGRKLMTNLPPNRARDVQRAFRARRAAHLEALEQRVAELEEENDSLRAALNLPKSNRVPLGKGPTGKDKAKPYLSLSRSGASQESLPSESRSPTGASPGSHSRATSSSPSSVTTSMHATPAMQNLDTPQWDQAMAIAADRMDTRSSRSPPGPSPLLPAHKLPAQYATYPSQVASSSRAIISGGMYMPEGTHTYPSPSNRSMANYSSTGYVLPNSRGDPMNYGYATQSFSSTSNADITQQHHPSGTGSLHPHHDHRSQPHVHSTLPYGHRRSITEPQPFRSQPFTHAQYASAESHSIIPSISQGRETSQSPNPAGQSRHP